MNWDFIAPIAASDVAQSWETLHMFLLAVCAFFFVIVIGPMILFAIIYRRKPGRKVSYFTHNFALEVTWISIPTIVVMAIFVWGWVVYEEMVYNVPQDHMEVRVVAKSWSWTFQYEDGRTTTNEMYIPVDTAVKVVMTSDINDVLHSFYVPNLRIKKDAVPGMYTTLWFRVNVIGQHQIFCTEYCGAGHSDMLAKLIVLSKEDYQLWSWGKEIELPPAVGVGAIPQPPGLVKAASPAVSELQDALQVASAESGTAEQVSLAEQGEKLSRAMGCVACHSDRDMRGIGPTYVGLFGKEVELANGETVIADENYIRESIENPQAKVVKGYENVLMPPYPGVLTEFELNALIAYIKTLK